MKMQRRQFLEIGGGAFAALALGGCRTFPWTGDEYSVPVLGDMHYDAYPKEKFHAKALKRWAEKGSSYPARLLEFDRNARMWQGICKDILAASSKCVRPDAAFMLQLGDLVQGDCEDDALHCQMLKEATDLLTGAYPGMPVVSLCGNHDIREGDDVFGSARAYRDFMCPFESAQLAAELPAGVKGTTFGFRRGKDLWIILDFNYGPRDVEIVRGLLRDNPDVRYTFVATHGPVLPMGVWTCRWFYLGWVEHDALRREIRALLANRKAIILAGHAHSLELKDWFGDGGRITEMILNTCAEGGFSAEPAVETENPSDYGKGAPEKEGTKSLYAEYRPGMKRYFVSRAVGHHVLRVTDSAVELDYYGHAALTPTKTFRLR